MLFFPNMNEIYFVERRLNKIRLNYLKSLAEKSGLFHVCDKWNEASILLSCESTMSETMEYLKKSNLEFYKKGQSSKSSFFLIVDLAWFHECLRAKKILDTSMFILNSCGKSTTKTNSMELSNDVLIPNKKLCMKPSSTQNHSYPRYACQTTASLNHYNKKFCDALETLELHALFRGDKNSESRALAFRRGSAALKSYHKEVSDENDLINIPFIGQANSSKQGHCKKVIMEILSQGYSDEVESVISSSFFQIMKKFCGVFGVGPSTARKWYHDYQFCSLTDVKASKISLTQDQVFGLQHYEDLNTAVTLGEAECIFKVIENVCLSIDKSLTVTLAGGFRRGKTEGHDVDLLISGFKTKKCDIIGQIIDHLKDNFIYTDKKMSSGPNIQEMHSSTIDHFEKCFSIFKFDNKWLKKSEGSKLWKAVRLDLVVVPHDQFAFALLGWTGSKHFEREIRRYARTEKKIILTSHNMYKADSNISLMAMSEQEIFENLDLIYRHPHERCF